MTWVAIGVTAGSAVLGAGMSSIAGGQQNAENAKLMKKQNEAKIAALKSQFNLDTQNQRNNEVAISQQKIANDVIIQKSAQQSRSQFLETFAGSGISGRTKDAIERDMEDEIEESHDENRRQAEATSDNQFVGLMRANQQMQASIGDLPSYDVGAAKARNEMAFISATVNAGIQAGGSYAKAKYSSNKKTK